MIIYWPTRKFAMRCWQHYHYIRGEGNHCSHALAYYAFILNYLGE